MKHLPLKDKYVTNKTVDFSNTEIAFQDKNNAELRRSKWLFSLMGFTPLVKMGPKFLTHSLKLGLPLDPLLKGTIFRLFCGGETLGECQRLIDKLYRSKVMTILDYAVEGGQDLDSQDQTVDEIIQAIHFGRGKPEIPFTVYKATGLCRHHILEKCSAGEALSAEEQQEYANFKQRVYKICETAATCGVRIFVDAEESWIQKAIDDMALEFAEQFNHEKPVIFITAQMYRHDRLEFLKSCIEQAKAKGFHLGVKLVRGAYMEKENQRALERGVKSPIHVSKQATDQDYNEALKLCFENIEHVSVCVATHNEDSCQLAAQLMQNTKINPNHEHVLFAQLLGMSDNISFNLAAAGFRAAKYVPYGPLREALPYLFRRAEENTSIGGQTGRELQLIMSELSRRTS